MGIGNIGKHLLKSALAIGDKVITKVKRGLSGEPVQTVVNGLSLGYSGIVVKPLVFDPKVFAAMKNSLAIKVLPSFDNPNMGCAGMTEIKNPDQK